MEDGWEEAAEDLREGLASPSAGREGQVPASLSSRHPGLLRMVWFGFFEARLPYGAQNALELEMLLALGSWCTQLNVWSFQVRLSTKTVAARNVLQPVG